jgi:L-rhamnose isomerase
MTFSISADFISAHNAKAQAAHDEDYAHLARQLERSGINIESITTKVMDYAVPAARALPVFQAPASPATSTTNSKTVA